MRIVQDGQSGTPDPFDVFARQGVIYQRWDYALVGMSIPDQDSLAADQANYNDLKARSLKLAPVLSRNRLACLDGS